MKVTLYKITDSNGQTYGGCQWGEGVQHETSGEGYLCGPGWTHWYVNPVLAVMLNPIHGGYDLKTAIMWKGEGSIGIDDFGLKVGCRDGKTLEKIELPSVTINQRIAFGILCAMEVYQKPEFIRWAKNWLSEKKTNITEKMYTHWLLPDSMRPFLETEDPEKAAALWAVNATIKADIEAKQALETSTTSVNMKLAEEAAAEAAAEAVEYAVEAASNKGKIIDLITLAYKALEIK